MTPIFADVKTLSQLIGISQRQILRMVAAGELPKPIPVSERRRLYSVSEVVQAIEAKRRAS